MGNMKKWLGFLMVFSLLGAAPVHSLSQGPMDRDFIFRQLARVGNEVEDFSADFIQEKRISLFRKEIVSHGTIQFKRPDKVLIEVFDPDPSLMIVEGNSLWLYFKRERVAQRYSVAGNPVLKRFLAILNNPFKGEWGRVTTMSEEDDSVVLDVMPGEAEAIFSKITFWVSTQDWLIRRLALYEKSGDVTILSYENIRVNTGIPDSRFRVDLPANVEILQPLQ
jgi:outer membrane lipoprotein-sorting protein